MTKISAEIRGKDMGDRISNGNSNPWAEVKALFEKALAIPEGRRAPFLDEACRDRPELRQEVEMLLTNYREAQGFFTDLRDTIMPIGAGRDALLGQRVGNYDILERLGEGGMGVVYKARHTALDQFAALKFLSARRLSMPGAKERLIQEARAAYALDHPNICTIYDVGETRSGQLFIAMAYYDGETLRDRVARGPFPDEQAFDLVIQICRGLERAHASSIVHGDVKPSNVLVTREGVAKLLDFGVALVLDSRSDAMAALQGTIAYMSPEQSLGGSVDTRTDIWSVGVLLHELLTGTHPFRRPGDDAQTVAEAIKGAEWRDGWLDAQRIPTAIEAILDRCLAQTPDRRYPSIDRLRDDILEVAGVQPDFGFPVPTSTSFGRAAGRRTRDPYITREADRRVLDALSSNGVTVTVKGPYQMGKSSLCLRVLDEAKASGKSAVVIDFQTFDRRVLLSGDQFFRTFCSSLSRAVQVDDAVDRYWSRPGGNPFRCSRYVARHILSRLDRGLVLCLDEVELLFEAPFRTDFFGMLRSWHNERALSAEWRKLDILLSTSTEPYDMLQTPNLSPFNVGQTVELEDFTEREVAALSEAYGHPLSASEVQVLTSRVHGHPYLVKTALFLMASHSATLGSIVERSADRDGPFGDHLNYHLSQLGRRPNLLAGFAAILAGKPWRDESVLSDLLGAGLVRHERSAVVPRCPLYADYFGRHLG